MCYNIILGVGGYKDMHAQNGIPNTLTVATVTVVLCNFCLHAFRAPT